MNSQKPYKYSAILILIILILTACTVKKDIKTTQPSKGIKTPDRIASTQKETVKQLKDIKFTQTDNQKTVTLIANNSLTYTIFKLSKPDRILVDLQDLIAAPSLTVELIKSELIKNITWSDKQYNNEKFLRLEIALSSDVTYNASGKENFLNIVISPQNSIITEK